DGPFDALRAADAEELGVLQGLDVVDELHLGVHDPDVGEARVRDEAVGPGHQADENRHLLGDEEGGDRQTEDNAEILAAVAGQHSKGDVDHRPAPFRFGAPRARMPAIENETMCSVSTSMSRRSGTWPSSRWTTG